MTKPGVPTSYDEIAKTTVPELGVFRPTPPAVTPSDTALEASVRETFRADARLAGLQIDVRARESIVLLTGTVIGRGTAAHAADLAKSVPGVVEVRNELVVLPGL